MKTLNHIEKPVTKLVKFQLADINQAIFHSTPPSVTVQPFIDLKDPVLSRSSFTFRLHIYEGLKSVLEVLAFSLTGNTEENYKYLKQLPDWILNLLYKQYKENFDAWADYFFENINEFCRTDSESIINWNLASKGGFSLLFDGKLNFEQKMWVSSCSGEEKKEWREFIIDIKESMLPWMNLELYQKVKEKETNTRENTAYEEQKKKLLEGKLEDLDIIS